MVTPAQLMEGFLDGGKLRRTGICALAEEANRRSALGVRSSLAQDASGKHGWMFVVVKRKKEVVELKKPNWRPGGGWMNVRSALGGG